MKRMPVLVALAALTTFATATGGLAQNTQGQNNNNQGVHAAPAPSIGTGVPAIMVGGGVLLGATLLKRRRQS